MKKILLVGGTHDGEWFSLENLGAHNEVCLPSAGEPAPVLTYDPSSPRLEGVFSLRHDRYRLRRFACESGDVELLASVDLSAAEVLEKLISGYGARSVELCGGVKLSPQECKQALDLAMRVIERVGTTGIYSVYSQAAKWMARYYPNWQ